MVSSSISTILLLCSFSSLAHNSSSLFTWPWIDLSSDCNWCIEFTKKLWSLFGSKDSSPPLVPPPSIVLARRSTYSVQKNGSYKKENNTLKYRVLMISNKQMSKQINTMQICCTMHHNFRTNEGFLSCKMIWQKISDFRAQNKSVSMENVMTKWAFVWPDLCDVPIFKVWIAWKFSSL